MFEAIHGSAPRIAGMNKANPSGLLLGAVQMLVYIGQKEVAESIQNAWLKTLEDGEHTYDIYKEGVSKSKLGTKEFAEAIISRLGQKPSTLQRVDYSKSVGNFNIEVTPTAPASKQLVGVDVFVHAKDISPSALAEKIMASANEGLELSMITNRGTKVWPDGFPETFCTDHWRCRFKATNGIKYKDVLKTISKIDNQELDIIKTENLYLFDGEQGFTAAQGQ
jgi:isocitrate dehydrogenase